MTRFLAMAALGGLAFVSACATQPRPCTPEWIDYRIDRTFSDFARENRSLLNAFRRVARADGSLDATQTILLAGRTEDIGRFARSFETVVVADLRSSLAQCGRDEAFVPALTEFLAREGVPQPALDWIGPMLALIQVSQPGGPQR